MEYWKATFSDYYIKAIWGKQVSSFWDLIFIDGGKLKLHLGGLMKIVVGNDWETGYNTTPVLVE